MTAATQEWLEKVHRDNAADLRSFLLRLTGYDRNGAEDLLQETMLRAWRHVAGVPRDPEGARRWLFTVARRLVIDAARARRSRPALVPMPDLGAFSAPDVTADSAVLADTVTRAFDHLSSPHRDVLTEVYLRGKEPAEVAARLGVPLGTVKSRTHYALRALRAEIEK